MAHSRILPARGLAGMALLLVPGCGAIAVMAMRRIKVAMWRRPTRTPSRCSSRRSIRALAHGS